MGTYTSSKGEQKDTTTMPIEYIIRALAKAKQNNDQSNIDVLEEEITRRNG